MDLLAPFEKDRSVKYDNVKYIIIHGMPMCEEAELSHMSLLPK